MWMKWLRRLWEIIKLCWAWRKEDRQTQGQARQNLETQIREIGHEGEMAKDRMEGLVDSSLDAELDRLQQRAKDHAD